MNIDLLEILVCPVCRSELSLREPEVENSQVLSGTLQCSLGHHQFPIVRGIPRLLPEAMPDVLHRTHRSFSFQWNRFPEIVEEIEVPLFQQYLYQLTVEKLKGKFGLDVGCGFGRYTYVATKHYGARMVGIDLSDAVEAARMNTEELDNVDIVQADIYHLPFKEEVFDFAFTLGVLHHLPDPKSGFEAIVPVVKPSGYIWVKVYQNLQKVGFWYKGLKLLRLATTHLPTFVVLGLSFVFACLERLLFHLPNSTLVNFSFTKSFAQKLPFKGHTNYPFKRLWADWLDNLSVPLWKSYTRDEMTRWFESYPGLNTAIPSEGDFGRALVYKP